MCPCKKINNSAANGRHPVACNQRLGRRRYAVVRGLPHRTSAMRSSYTKNLIGKSLSLIVSCVLDPATSSGIVISPGPAWRRGLPAMAGSGAL
ncbi:hypothetical protein I547_4233 [Mycobacterium kansasii 824]|nr:hypothetical protein I547_4233 [Mycobacterium kansasii 824]